MELQIKVTIILASMYLPSLLSLVLHTVLSYVHISLGMHGDFLIFPLGVVAFDYVNL